MKITWMWIAASLLTGAASALASEWRVVSVDGTPVIGQPQMTFADGGISGDTGCNRFRVSGNMQDGALVITGPVATTRMACPGEALTAQENAIIGAFEGTLSVSLDLFTDQVALSSNTVTLVLARLESSASEDDGPQVHLGRNRPAGDPPYMNPYGLAEDMPLHAEPDTASDVVGGAFSGQVLRNEGCAGDWCKLEALDASVTGWGERRYLEASTSALRAGQGVFDVVARAPCAVGVGAPMTHCAMWAARDGSGSATVVIIKPDGIERVLFFDGGQFVGADTSQAGGGFESSVTREADLNMIRVDEERYEIPDAVIFGG